MRPTPPRSKAPSRTPLATHVVPQSAGVPLPAAPQQALAAQPREPEARPRGQGGDGEGREGQAEAGPAGTTFSGAAARPQERGRAGGETGRGMEGQTEEGRGRVLEPWIREELAQALQMQKQGQYKVHNTVPYGIWCIVLYHMVQVVPSCVIWYMIHSTVSERRLVYVCCPLSGRASEGWRSTLFS